MTTRKLFRALPSVALLAVLTSCATPGPLHIYALPAGNAANIADFDAEQRSEIPSFVAPDEHVIGFAYDPFTDHFFLRLAPGDRIRVVDRPARAIKREFAVPELAGTDRRSDLAIRPRDGHVFAPHPYESALVEFTRLGKFVRTVPLAGFAAPPIGVALDLERNRLLTLREKNSVAWLQIHGADGGLLSEMPLAVAATEGIGYDSATGEIYAALAAEDRVGIFDETGKLLRTLAQPAAFLDLGPRSFIRVF